MNQSRKEGSQTLRKVLSFTLGHWARRKWLAGAVALFMCLSTLTEVIVPLYAGHLVDALARGSTATREAVTAFACMGALGILMVLFRHLGWSGIVPLTLRIMRDVAQGAFHRVQRFSTDWHNNTFAG